MWLNLLMEIVVVPVLKQLVVFGSNKLKKAKNGIPKEVGIVMLDAIAENEANSITNEDLVRAKELL